MTNLDWLNELLPDSPSWAKEIIAETIDLQLDKIRTQQNLIDNMSDTFMNHYGIEDEELDI